MTILFASGFESAFSGWTTTSGNVSTVASPVRTGAFAARALGDVASFWQYNFSAAQPNLYVRGYYDFPALPAVNQWVALLYIYDPSWSNTVSVGLWNDGVAISLALVTPSGTYSSPLSLTPNTWNCIEVRRATGVGSGIAALWLNGSLLQQRTTETFTAGSQVVIIGSMPTPANFTVYGDDFVLADSYVGPDASGTVSLTVVAGTGGTVSPSGTANYNIGQQYTFTATPSAGNAFSRWDLAGATVGTSATYSPTIDATFNGKTLTAIFTASTGTLNVTSTLDGAALTGVSVTLSGTTKTTPASFTLGQGSYTVSGTYGGQTVSTPATVTAGGTSSVNLAFTSGAPTVLFADGLDSGSFSPNWGIAGTPAPTIVTSPVYQGAYAALAVGPTAYWTHVFGATYPTLYTRGFFYVPVLPVSGQWVQILTIWAADYNFQSVAAALWNSGGVLQWVLTTDIDATTTHPFPATASVQANRYYCVEIRRTVGTGNGVMELYIDGNRVAQSNTETFAVNAGSIGAGSMGSPTGFQVYGDSFAAAEAYIGTGNPPVQNGTLLVLAQLTDGTAVTATVSISQGGTVVATGTSGTAFTLPAGTYTVTAGYGGTIQTKSATVSANTQSTQTFTFTPPVGTVIVNAYQDSTPIAAAVTLDGQSGTTKTSGAPLQFSVTANTYTLVASYQGTSLPPQTITVAAGGVVTVNLKFTIPTYILTIQSSPTGAPITVDGTPYTSPMTLQAGSHVVVAAATFVSGGLTYAFKQWEDATTNVSRTINLASNTAISATYTQTTYNITVNSAPSGIGVSVDGTAYTTNTGAIPVSAGVSHTISVPATFVSGGATYAFQQWEDGSKATTRSITLSADKVVTATYAQVYWNLTVQSSPAGVTVNVDSTPYTTNTAPISLPAGSHAVSVPASFVSGASTYTFQHWEDGTLNTSRSITLTADRTVVATYAAVKYNLSVNSSPVTGIPITVDGAAFTTNTGALSLDVGQHTVVVPATFTSGSSLYGFQSWEDGTTAATRVVQLSANKSIVATYALVFHNLTVGTAPITGVSISVDGLSYATNVVLSLTHGSHSVTVPAKVTVGSQAYAFQSWDNGSTSLTRNISLTADLAITATYAIVYHSLTANSSPASVPITIDNTPYTTNVTVSLTEGSHTISVPATIVQGTTTYNFQRWEDGSTNTSRDVQLTADRTVTATYVAVHPSLTVIASPSAGGTVSTSPSPPYDVNQTVSISAITNTGYTFIKWVNEDGSQFSAAPQASLTLNVLVNGSYNRTLTAMFQGITPNLTLGSYLTAQEAPPYAYGQSVHVTANPQSGFKLVGWLKDGSPFDTTSNPVTVVMDGDHALSGVFEAKTHNLVVTSSPITNVAVTVDGASYNTPTSTISLAEGSHTVVAPNKVANYLFQQWEDGTTNPSRTLSLTADKTITCFFVESTHTLTISSVPSGVPATIDGVAYTGPTSLTDGTHVVDVPALILLGNSTYSFQSWENGTTNPNRSIFISADTAITATYQLVIPKHNLVVASFPSGVPVTVDGISYATTTPPISLQEGQHTVTIPALIISGRSTYAFQSWEDGSANTTRTITLTADVTISATYAIVRPTLSLVVSPAGAGTASASPTPPYDVGDIVTISAVVSDTINFRWLKWVQENGADYSQSATTTVQMNANRTLTAVFESVTHPTLTVITNPAEGGTVDVQEPPPYNINQTVHLTANASITHMFAGWLLDGAPVSGQTATLAVLMDVSHVVTASFIKKSEAGFPWIALVVGVPAAAVFTYYGTKSPQGKKAPAKGKRRVAKRRRRKRR